MDTGRTIGDDDRLEPTPTTIKELFAKSGNECAFTVAQIAHIVGVKPNSARYAAIDSEEKRAPSNLLILCYAHHKETDNAERFPVPAMREMKERHEHRFGGLVQGLSHALYDQTNNAAIRMPQTMAAYREEFDLNDAEVERARRHLEGYVSKLARLPVVARSVLATIVERGTYTGENSYEITFAEVRDVLGTTDGVINEQLGTLQRNGYTELDLEQREGYADLFLYTLSRQPGDSGPVLDDIRWAHDHSGIPVANMIVGLDFAAFDASP